MIGLDRHVGDVQVDGQTDAARADMRQRPEEWTARQEALFVKLLVNPGEETIEGRFGLFLPAGALCRPCQSVVANLLLDLVQAWDRVERLIRVGGFDVPGIVDFSARMCPALRVGDSRRCSLPDRPPTG